MKFRTPFVCVALLILWACSPVYAGWHTLASFQGKGTKTTDWYTFDTKWRVRWSCKKTAGWGSGDPYFYLWARSAVDSAHDALLANRIDVASERTDEMPPGSYRFDAGCIGAWWQFQIEVWEGPPDPKPAEGNVRTWTAFDGRTVEAEYISANLTHVKFRRVSDGSVFEYELAKLSEADRAWVADRQSVR